MKNFLTSFRVIFGVFIFISISIINSVKADYYYNSGNPTVVSNWGNLPGGGGTPPPDFVQNTNYFIGNGKYATIPSSWTVRNLIVQGGGTLQSDAPIYIWSTFTLDSNSTYIHNNTEYILNSIFQGSENLKRGSNFIIKKWSPINEALTTNLSQNSTNFFYGNLEIDRADGTGDWFQIGNPSGVNFCDGNFKITSLGDAVFVPHLSGSSFSSYLIIK